jgi:hypothetical protein
MPVPMHILCGFELQKLFFVVHFTTSQSKTDVMIVLVHIIRQWQASTCRKISPNLQATTSLWRFVWRRTLWIYSLKYLGEHLASSLVVRTVRTIPMTLRTPHRHLSRKCGSLDVSQPYDRDYICVKNAAFLTRRLERVSERLFTSASFL